MKLYEAWTAHVKEDKPFVIYKKPNQNKVIGLLQQDKELYQVQDFKEQGFVMAPFYEGVRFYIPQDKSIQIEEEFTQKNEHFGSFELNFNDKKAKADFEDLVQRCVDAIKQGTFGKVVPSRKERIQLKIQDLKHLFSKLAKAYGDAFCYVIYHPEIGLWMGATPETLVELEEQTLRTMALAGTQVNHGREEVEWGIKEREEQQYVTDFIVDQLTPLSDTIQVSEPFTKRAAKVMHICTAIEASMKQVNLKEIVEALHPTPAVCGMPKQVARDFLIAQEGYSRKYYAGYVGELNYSNAVHQQTSKLFVNLRCMEIEKESVNLYIGCGVTVDSDPSSEFIETVNKSTTMKKVLF